MTYAPEIYTQFILGILPPEKQEELEKAMLGDQDVFLSLSEAEDLLVDGYVRGSLNTEQTVDFEKVLSASPVLTERVRFARALVRVGRENKAGIASPHPWALTAAAAIVILLAGNIWFGLQVKDAEQRVKSANNNLGQEQVKVQDLLANKDQQTQELSKARDATEQLQQDLSSKEMELERLANQTTVAPRNSKPVLLSLLMATEVLRGPETETPALALPGDVDGVRLQLDLGAAPVASSYRVYLTQDDGTVLWSRGNLRAKAAGPGHLVEVTLPAAVLRRHRKTVTVRLDEADDHGFFTVALLPLQIK